MTQQLDRWWSHRATLQLPSMGVELLGVAEEKYELTT